MHTHSKIDYSSVNEHILVGTNACCASHFVEELLEKGVRADISLEEKHFDTPIGVDFYLWLPTQDHAAPSPEKLTLGAKALRFFVEKKITCYVHCKNGHGRAPTLVAAYFIAEEKMTAEEAVAFVEEKRSGAHVEPAQRRALREFEKWNREEL